jgi:hypothetical protein
MLLQTSARAGRMRASLALHSRRYASGGGHYNEPTGNLFGEPVRVIRAGVGMMADGFCSLSPLVRRENGNGGSLCGTLACTVAWR